MTDAALTYAIGRWEKATNEKLDALARQTCLAVAKEAVMLTPVDTGFLRGSWQPAIGAASTEPGSEDPAGAAALARVSVAASDVKAGDVFYMTNNASYARFVEYGTSKMAGRHFVSDAVKKWPVIVASVAAKLGLKK